MSLIIKKFCFVEWTHKKLTASTIIEKSIFEEKIKKIKQITNSFSLNFHGESIHYKNGNNFLSEISHKELTSEEKNTLERFIKFQSSEPFEFILGINIYSEEEIQKAYEEINKITAEISDKVKEAEKIADKYSLSFRLSIAYGMAGTYCGKGYDNYADYRAEGEWLASSQSC